METRRHCGDAKANWFVENVTVDPTTAVVESLFRFPLSGKIFPSKTLQPIQYNAVDTTIAKLNLNAPSLVARRSALLAKATADSYTLDRASWRSCYLDLQGDQCKEFWPALHYNYTKHWSKNFL